MNIRKNTLLGIVFLSFALFCCRELFFGLGYVSNFNFIVPKEMQRSYMPIMVLIIPSILYAILGLSCFYKPAFFERYSMFKNLRSTWRNQRKREKLEFSRALLGLGLIMTAFPLITNKIFQLMVIGVEGMEAVSNMDKNYLSREIYNPSIIAILLGVFGYFLIKKQAKVAD